MPGPGPGGREIPPPKPSSPPPPSSLTRPVCCRAVTSTTSLPPIWPGALYGQRAEGGMCTGKEQDVRTAALRGSVDDVFLAGFKMAVERNTNEIHESRKKC